MYVLCTSRKQGTDVIRAPIPAAMNNKPAMNNEMVYPDDKVGHDPGTYDPYNAGPYDLEVPPYNDYDDVDEVMYMLQTTLSSHTIYH